MDVSSVGRAALEGGRRQRAGRLQGHAADFRQQLLYMDAPEGTAKAIVAACFLGGIVLRAYTTTPPDAGPRPRCRRRAALMWTILGSIFGHIGAGLVSAFGDSVLAPILNTVQNRRNANRDVAMQTFQAEIAANQAGVASAPGFKGLIYCIGLPPAACFGAICAVSAPWWFPFYGWRTVNSWNVVALPGDYATIEATIPTAFFVSSPLTTLDRAGAARLLKA